MELKGKFWRVDQQLLDAQRLPGWRAFHRQCGDSGVFFVIDGRRGDWLIEAVRYEKTRSDFYREIALANARSEHPVAGCLAAFDGARRSDDAIGRALDPAIAAHLRPADAPPLDTNIAALLGGETATDPVMDLVG